MSAAKSDEERQGAVKGDKDWPRKTKIAAKKCEGLAEIQRHQSEAADQGSWQMLSCKWDLQSSVDLSTCYFQVMLLSWARVFNHSV